jgi:hypothetical protein
MIGIKLRRRQAAFIEYKLSINGSAYSLKSASIGHVATKIMSNPEEGRA